MMIMQDKRPRLNSSIEKTQREAGHLYALITGRRSVSRRNRCSWYLRQMNKEVSCDSFDEIENDDNTSKADNNIGVQEKNNKAGSSIGRTTSSINEEERLELLENQQNNSSEKDIYLVSITSNTSTCNSKNEESTPQQNQPGNSTTFTDPIKSETRFLVTPNTHVLYLSKSVATSIILDLSPSVVSVSPQNDCVFLDSMFDALKRVLHLLVKSQEIPSSEESRQPFILTPKVFVSVIAYTPFIVAKNNQVLVQNRRISAANIDQVLVEIWLCLSKLIQEIHELVTSTCGFNLGYVPAQNSAGSAINFPQPLNGSIIRHPGSVLEDIFQLALFSSQLMPRLSRLSMVTITDGLFSLSNDLSLFRLRSVAASFVSLGMEAVHPDGCFGYTPYTDLMRFVAKTTQGFHITHQELIESSMNLTRSKQIPFTSNPMAKLFYWTLHSSIGDDRLSCTPKVGTSNPLETIQVNPIDMRPEHIARFFCIDQPVESFEKSILPMNSQAGSYSEQPASSQNYHDWRSFKQLERNLDADFEQVLSCLLREGYLIKSIQFKHRETSRIVARLVLHWKHNLDIEQELTAPYWNTADPFDLNDGNNLILRPFNAPLYGDTNCELYVHGSYSFLHNLYCDKKVKRRTDYRESAYRQFRQLIDGVIQTHDRLQYLSRFYRDPSLAKVPPFLLHGNSLLFEQPHTHKLTSTIENVVNETKTNEFQDYWQKISCIDSKSWTNLMHVHAVRLVLENDQPKYKSLHCQNTNGRYPQVQCRRALSGVSNFIKKYSSFALLEDSLYVKFIYNRDDDLRDIGTSSTKGFIVIQIKKILPTVVIYLMFTSGILDSYRVQIVSHIERCLNNCRLRSGRTSTVNQSDNILKSKTVYSMGESCCTLLKSPLERMFRIYNRHFISDHLSHNLSIGLPGSYSIIANQQHQQQSQQQPSSVKMKQSINQTNKNRGGANINSNNLVCDQHYQESESDNLSTISRHNLIFSKYLYGVRVVHTLANLPNKLVQLIANNVLVKISGILVNIRIKEGFRIALSNSGILNLVVELSMSDHSHDFHSSTCLGQYIVFPPIITSCPPSLETTIQVSNSNSQQQLMATSNNSNGLSNSKPNSLSGSTDMGGYTLRNTINSQQDTTNPQAPTMIVKNENKGEIKVVREYWIEQQYGTSARSSNYHESLENMRYPELVDHLFLTDSDIFECLLNYELLQLQCDKLSPFYELDKVLASKSDLLAHHHSIFSPTSSISSSSSSSSLSAGSSTILDPNSPSGPSLPSKLIDGNSKSGCPKIPLLELTYQFSLVNFLDYCQQASLTVLMFKYKSHYFEDLLFDSKRPQQHRSETRCQNSNDCLNKIPPVDQSQAPKQQTVMGKVLSRKMSMDVSKLERDYGRREHRSSYDNLASNSNVFVNPICSPSLNHLFLETLHKRLKQIHDKEHKLSESDQKRLASYLLKRATRLRDEAAMHRHRGQEDDDTCPDDEDDDEGNTFSLDNESIGEAKKYAEHIDWRCFLRKGNQENLLIVLIPATIGDVTKWMNLVEGQKTRGQTGSVREPVCPIFVFRCSSSMINDQVLAHLNHGCNQRHNDRNNQSKSCSDSKSPTRHVKSGRRLPPANELESDLGLHFGQPCRYMSELQTTNDELDNEMFPMIRLGAPILNQPNSDEKTSEIVHFRAFLRKIKNTVLKSRFSSLNDAYLSELFIHKDDILYYMNNVDLDTQKKYHVSTQLKNLAEFIKNYEDYTESLPKEPTKQCNPLLNSILLQKCGLFINQPIARFNEANPLMKQLNDRKLLFLMRCNYKIELPILEENLSGSTLLKSFITTTKPIQSYSNGIHHHPHHHHHQHHHHHHHHQHHQCHNHAGPSSSMGRQQTHNTLLSTSINETTSLGGSGGRLSTSIGVASEGQPNVLVSSLGRSSEGSRLMDVKCGSMGATSSSNLGSPSANFVAGPSTLPPSSSSSRISARYSSTSCLTLNNLSSPTNDSFILEAFRRSSCPMDEISTRLLSGLLPPISPSSSSSQEQPGLPPDVGLRHEAHMAEVLRRKGERKESHHYRRVLKSKTSYNQSHSAIDQALKRVDSLGRLEHFCLTPLLFSPSWRSKLAPVRDHTLEPHSNRSNSLDDGCPHDTLEQLQEHQLNSTGSSQAPSFETNRQQQQQEADERWHQMVCNNYIKEYEQYIQTLGFNSVQIRYPTNTSTGNIPGAASGVSSGIGTSSSKVLSRKSSKNLEQTAFPASSSTSSSQATITNSWNLNSNAGATLSNRYLLNNGSSTSKKRESIATVSNALVSTPTNAYDTGYLIKFLNSGCLVFKVGFCKPYVYSILYSIEGERFNNSNLKMNMAAFLDELDNIKVTMHLHSFTYDYHLRSIYSYISGRQMTFSPGYHLISFVDDFRKYYQKAPNYARNHILSGEICVTDLQVSGQQLYNYIVTHSSAYSLEVLEMASSIARFISSAGFIEYDKNPNNTSVDHKQDLFSKSSLGSGSIRDVVQEINNSSRSHANDYVLIELKREKVRYRDGKDPDVFECGLLITHDVHDSTLDGKNCLILKYFLLLTNQRDLYPKLVHKDDAMIGLGCHRPIRLGVVQLNGGQSGQRAFNSATSDIGASSRLAEPAKNIDDITAHTTSNIIMTPAIDGSENNSAHDVTLVADTGGLDVVGPILPGGQMPGAPPSIITMATTTTATSTATTATTGQSDQEDFQSSDLLSSGEISGPQSVISTANSILSGSSLGGQSQRAFVVANNATTLSSVSNIPVAGVKMPTAATAATINQGATASTSQMVLDSPTDILANYPLAKAQMQLQLQQLPVQLALDATEMAADALNLSQVDGLIQSRLVSPLVGEPNQHLQSKLDAGEPMTSLLPSAAAAKSQMQSNEANEPLRSPSAASRHRQQQTSATRERAICDEEITYLGYFSSDEMDMLKFLHEKTINLRQHIEQIVHRAEIHYRRDSLWQKLMQRNESCSSAGNSGGAGHKLLVGYDQQLPLTTDELLQLLQIVEAIDLASLDPQLAGLATLHVNWYMKLLKAFNDLKQSSINQHRIFHLKVSKNLLLFIDPKCTTAFILLTVDQDRGSVELNMLLKDKQECVKVVASDGNQSLATKLSPINHGGISNKCLADDDGSSSSLIKGSHASLELEQECQQLINDFVNFCATFMWSTFLS